MSRSLVTVICLAVVTPATVGGVAIKLSLKTVESSEGQADEASSLTAGNLSSRSPSPSDAPQRPFAGNVESAKDVNSSYQLARLQFDTGRFLKAPENVSATHRHAHCDPNWKGRQSQLQHRASVSSLDEGTASTPTSSNASVTAETDERARKGMSDNHKVETPRPTFDGLLSEDLARCGPAMPINGSKPTSPGQVKRFIIDDEPMDETEKNPHDDAVEIDFETCLDPSLMQVLKAQITNEYEPKFFLIDDELEDESESHSNTGLMSDAVLSYETCFDILEWSFDILEWSKADTLDIEGFDLH